IGRSSQLLRVFRPDRVPPPPPRLDAVELLTMLVEKSPEFQGTPKVPLQPDQPHEAAQDRREAERRPQPKPTQLSSTQPTPTQPRPEQQRPAQLRPAQQRPTQQAPTEQASTTQPGSNKPAARRTTKPRNMTLQANPFVVAAAVAITGAWAVVAADW